METTNQTIRQETEQPQHGYNQPFSQMIAFFFLII